MTVYICLYTVLLGGVSVCVCIFVFMIHNYIPIEIYVYMHMLVLRMLFSGLRNEWTLECSWKQTGSYCFSQNLREQIGTPESLV